MSRRPYTTAAARKTRALTPLVTTVGPPRVGGHVIVADWGSGDFGVDGSVT
jgi:hypothetical protein